MTRTFSSSSGPTMLLAETLEQTQRELCDWNSLDISVMEVDHRGRELTQVAKETEEDLRDLLSVPSSHKVLFHHGDGHGQFATVPLNTLGDKTTTDYVDAGHWAASAIREAKKYCIPNVFDAKVTTDGLRAVKPVSEQQLSGNTAYMHYCPNEIIGGIAVDETPDPGRDMMAAADFSSTTLSHPIDVSHYSVIYAGAQKNADPADPTIVVVREGLLDKASIACPSILDCPILNNNDSMFSTPPTSTWYLSGLVFKWLETNGGVTAMDKINQQKTELLYRVIDNNDFYRNDMMKADCSRINVPSQLVDSALDKLFLEEPSATDLHALEGHQVADGVRAFIYDAIPLEDVKALTGFMVEFEYCRG